MYPNNGSNLYSLHTLDIASSNAAVIYYGLPSPVVPAAAGNPWTFPRPRKHATGMFSSLATLGPGFQVQRRISKKSVDKNRQTFLAGALGLEFQVSGVYGIFKTFIYTKRLFCIKYSNISN